MLDTGVLYYPTVLRALATSGARVVLPTVAFAERIRQYRRDRRNVGDLARDLDRLGVDVEPFGIAEAYRASTRVAGDHAWRGRASDALVAAHVRDGDQLWTTNPDDFLALGLPARFIRIAPGGGAADTV